MSVENFVASLKRWDSTFAAKIDKVVERVAFVCVENLIVGGEYAPGTPVDTGFARASWWVSIGAAPDGQPGGDAIVLGPGGNVAGQGALNAATLAILGVKAGQSVWILNGAHYIKWLEYGHSGQAPAGFVRLTLRHGQQILDQAARDIFGSNAV